MNSMVCEVKDEKESRPLFTGTFEEISNYMAAEYQTKQYDKIVLAGPYAEAVQDRIITYSKTNYNYDNINIEVIK
jgi:hypothetical protein